MNILNRLAVGFVLLVFSAAVYSDVMSVHNPMVSIKIEPVHDGDASKKVIQFNFVAVTQADVKALRIMIRPQGSMELVEGQLLWQGAALAKEPVQFKFKINRQSLKASGMLATAVITGKKGAQNAARYIYRFPVYAR